MIHFCVKLALYQIEHGRYFVIENPSASQLWRWSPVYQLTQNESCHFITTHLCMFGLQDPDSGLPYRKSLGLLTNLPTTILTPLEEKCHNHPEHQVVEGTLSNRQARSQFTQIYPWKFCRRFAACLNKFFTERKRPMNPTQRRTRMTQYLSLIHI